MPIILSSFESLYIATAIEPVFPFVDVHQIPLVPKELYDPDSVLTPPPTPLKPY